MGGGGKEQERSRPVVGYQSGIPGPAASASAGNLLETPGLRFHPRPAESGTGWGWGGPVVVVWKTTTVPLLPAIQIFPVVSSFQLIPITYFDYVLVSRSALRDC